MLSWLDRKFEKIEWVSVQRELRRVAEELKETQSELAVVKSLRFPIATAPCVSDELVTQRLDHLTVRLQDSQKCVKDEIGRLKKEVESAIGAEQRLRRSELDKMAKTLVGQMERELSLRLDTRNLQEQLSSIVKFDTGLETRRDSDSTAVKYAEMSSSTVSHALRRISEAELDASEARRRSEITQTSVEEQLDMFRGEYDRKLKHLEIVVKESVNDLSVKHDERYQLLDERVVEIENAIRVRLDNMQWSVQQDIKSIRESLLRNN